ncbi:MAG TPA: aldehyde dehydrogenase family protein, partial [Acidobacteriota bacterium]|nr:aldehyde dehydrogenase family protein [Acidobacteriota bacterium]
MTTPRKTYKLFINGEFVDAVDGKTFPDYNPATGQVIANVSEAGSNDVCWAVESAQAALKGPWGRMAMTDRLNLLRKVADGIETRFNDFVDAEIADTGKPRSLACAVDIPRGAANFRIFAEIARSFATECFEMDTEDGAGAINYSLRVPLGVVGVICPWNLPLLLMTWKVAPALA